MSFTTTRCLNEFQEGPCQVIPAKFQRKHTTLGSIRFGTLVKSGGRISRGSYRWLQDHNRQQNKPQLRKKTHIAPPKSQMQQGSQTSLPTQARRRAAAAAQWAAGNFSLAAVRWASQSDDWYKPSLALIASCFSPVRNLCKSASNSIHERQNPASKTINTSELLSQVEVQGCVSLSSPVVILSSDDEDASSCFSSISVSQDSAQGRWQVQDSFIIESCDPLCRKTSERLQSARSSSYVSNSDGEDEIIYRRAAGVPWSHSSDYASDEDFLTDSDDGDDDTDAAKVCHVHLCLL